MVEIIYDVIDEAMRADEETFGVLKKMFTPLKVFQWIVLADIHLMLMGPLLSEVDGLSGANAYCLHRLALVTRGSMRALLKDRKLLPRVERFYNHRLHTAAHKASFDQFFDSIAAAADRFDDVLYRYLGAILDDKRFVQLSLLDTNEDWRKYRLNNVMLREIAAYDQAKGEPKLQSKLDPAGILTEGSKLRKNVIAVCNGADIEQFPELIDALTSIGGHLASSTVRMEALQVFRR